MRSWTEGEERRSLVLRSDAWRRKLAAGSGASARCATILPSPQAWQTETALVDQAVVKFMRGPTSRIKCGRAGAAAGSRKLVSGELLGLEGLGQEPAEQAHLVARSAALSAAMLKQNSVAIPWIAGETDCCAALSSSAA